MSAIVKLDSPISSRFPTPMTAIMSSMSSTCGRSCNIISGGGPRARRQAASPSSRRAGKASFPPASSGWTSAPQKSGFGGACRLKDGEDKAPVLALQKAVYARPLEPFRQKGGKTRGRKPRSLANIAGDDLGFFVHLAAALKNNRVNRTTRLYLPSSRGSDWAERLRPVQADAGAPQRLAARAPGRPFRRRLRLHFRRRHAQRLELGDRARQFRLLIILCAPWSRVPISAARARRRRCIPCALPISAGQVLTGRRRPIQ